MFEFGKKETENIEYNKVLEKGYMRIEPKIVTTMSEGKRLFEELFNKSDEYFEANNKNEVVDSDKSEAINNNIIQDNSESKESKNKYIKDGSVYETDDNGNTYKKDGELLPNTEYEIGGYKYTTDEKGRITSAEGQLHLSDTGRKTINEDNVGGEDKLDTDDRGHLIADRFDGSNKIENLVAMDSNLNRGEYKALENKLADALSDGKDVRMRVEPIYEGDSKRPSGFQVVYSINGEVSVKYFSNERS